MAGPLRFPESTKPINKVVLNGDIKIDLTGDTVQPSNLLKGIKAHGPDGNIITGTITPVLYGEVQNLTDTEKKQAQQNIGIDPDSFLQKPVLLWTNASPTSTLVTQDIAIDDTYPFLLCVGTNGGFVLDNTERGGVLTQSRWRTISNNLHVTLQTRAIHRVAGGKVRIENAYGYDFNVDSGKMNTKQDNTECILYQIWGIK